MNVVRLKTPCKDAEVHLYLVGDEHIGTRYHAETELQKTVSKIRADPLARWIGMGDKCDFIVPSDPRWDSGSIADWVRHDNIALDQANRYCDVMSPIIDKCDGLLFGNHESAIRRHNHIDVHSYICDKLNVRDLGVSAWVHYQFELTKTMRSGLNVVVLHGSGSARTKAARVRKLTDAMASFNADIIGYGHLHDMIPLPGIAPLDINSACKLKQRKKVGTLTGCYFRTYTQNVPPSYGEERNYPPTVMGSPVFTITFDWKTATPDVKVTT